MGRLSYLRQTRRRTKFNLSKKWKRALIQSGFSCNYLEDHRSSGPRGIRLFIDKDNSLFFQAETDKESCYQIITIDDGVIGSCVKLGD